ncbi:MAG: TMEM175 family protein [Nitrospirales bacterium]
MRNWSRGVFLGHLTSLERLNALTDGVYAIVITLLVLDLKVPETPGLTTGQLLIDLQEQIPNFAAWILSFYMAAFLWMRNFWILKHLQKCDEKTFWLNFVHLMFVSLIPYAASLLGHYEEDTIAVVIFSSTLGLASFSLLILHQYVAAKREWHLDGAPRLWTNPNLWAMYPAPLFAIGSILISFNNVNGAIAFWFLAPLWTRFFWQK